MKTNALFFASIVIMGAVVSTADVSGQEAAKEGQLDLFCPDPSEGKNQNYESFRIRAKRMLNSDGHPHPVYAHSRAGIDATRTHRWNQAQAQQRPWHGGYYHPAYGQPLALLVPPTASFQTVYSWGVGNTQSIPIYHQFGRPYPGRATGATPGMYRQVPSPQWNTQQFGVYYSRAPW